jgi:hypothetical protein
MQVSSSIDTPAAVPSVAGTAYHRRCWWLEVVGGGALLGGCLLVFERRIARAAWTLLGRAS